MGFWKKNKLPAWLGGAFLGILFLVTGILQGQFAIIWKKAVMICMECIGIG